MPPLGFSPELDEGTTSCQFFVSCNGFLSRRVLFTRLCPARHLRTWLTTHTWFRKVQDVDSTQQSFCRQMCCASVEQHTICQWTSGVDVLDLPKLSVCRQPSTEVPGRTKTSKQNTPGQEAIATDEELARCGPLV